MSFPKILSSSALQASLAAIILPDGTCKKDDSGQDVPIKVPNTDSGVFLRGQHKSQVNIWCWPVGSGEVWGYRADPAFSPGVHAGVTPEVRADRPMCQWNTFHIIMKGDRLTVTLNEQLVLDKAQLPGVPARGPICADGTALCLSVPEDSCVRLSDMACTVGIHELQELVLMETSVTLYFPWLKWPGLNLGTGRIRDLQEQMLAHTTLFQYASPSFGPTPICIESRPGRIMATTKKNLIDRIAENTGERQSLVKTVIQQSFDEIIADLAKGNRLEFRDFGVFETKTTPPRMAQNPRTLEKVRVPAKRRVVLRPGRMVKGRLNGKTSR